MHTAAHRFVADNVTQLGPFARVIELGSRDLNGSVRPLFGDADYLGVDVVDGPGVDLVVPADEMAAWTPEQPADCVVCCEVLEHVEDWPSVLATARRALKPGGVLIVTAAGPGRRPHSGIDGTRRLHPGEHYANIDPYELTAALREAGFTEIDIDVLGNDIRASATSPLLDADLMALIDRMSYSVVVEIPFQDQYQRTRSLAEQVLADPDVDLLILDDNGSSGKQIGAWLDSLDGDPRVEVNRRPPLGPTDDGERGLSIYTLWNDAIDRAETMVNATVVLLNNDVRIPDGFCGHLARALAAAPDHVAAVYPDWRRPIGDGVEVDGTLTETTGAWSQGGLSGFAFAIRSELVVHGLIERFDERYEWIYGDGDFVEALERAGFTAARVEGLPLEHDKSTTAKASGWTKAAKARDTERRQAKVAEREQAG